MTPTSARSPAETIRVHLRAIESLVPERVAAIEEALAVLGRQLAETEAYAKEGWDWLDEALAALGAKTVFDIKETGRRLAEKDEALRQIEALVGIATNDWAAKRLAWFHEIKRIAREALRAEPAECRFCHWPFDSIEDGGCAQCGLPGGAERQRRNAWRRAEPAKEQA